MNKKYYDSLIDQMRDLSNKINRHYDSVKSVHTRPYQVTVETEIPIEDVKTEILKESPRKLYFDTPAKLSECLLEIIRNAGQISPKDFWPTNKVFYDADYMINEYPDQSYCGVNLAGIFVAGDTGYNGVVDTHNLVDFDKTIEHKLQSIIFIGQGKYQDAIHRYYGHALSSEMGEEYNKFHRLINDLKENWPENKKMVFEGWIEWSKIELVISDIANILKVYNL